MKSIVVELRCPYCGASSHHKSETLLIQGFESDYEKQLREGNFFRYHCPVCGKDSKLLHQLLYVDKPHHFILLVKPKKDQKASDQELYRGDTHLVKRYISDVASISEKIRILEDHLDDRCMEVLKMKLYLHYQKAGKNVTYIRYRDYDLESKTLWFDIETDAYEDVAGLDVSAYETMKNKMPTELLEFYEVDWNWALAWMKEQSKGMG